MHAKSKISEMLPKSFKAQKCKTSLKLAVSRMKLLKNKREALVKQMRRDLAQLLETGQDQSARIRVEHVIKEEKTMTAYDLIEIYCEMIDSRLPIIESQKSCPIDLKEAIASVIFASPRCADIPELMDIRKQFAAKYGKDFVKAALEVRPDCGVSNMMIAKLSVKAPDIQTKSKVLNEVAKEHNIKWEPKAFEAQVEKPKDDLLSGPSSFISSEMAMKSSDVKPSFVDSWNNQATPSFSQDNTSSQAQDVRSTRVAEESISMTRSNWKMEFKDATSAAEAAAESAERASMAARAAADLASRGNISRQASGATHNPSVYAVKREGPESVKSSYAESNFNSRGSVTVEDNERRDPHIEKKIIHNLPKDELVQSSAFTVDENINSLYSKSNRNSGGSVIVVDNEREGSVFVKPKMQNLQQDELACKSTSTVDETLSRYLSSREKSSERPEFNSSSMNRVEVSLNLGEENDMSSYYAQQSFKGLGPTPKNVKNDNSGNYDQRRETVPSVYSCAFTDYKTKDEHENNIEGDSVGVCYDNYDTDTEDHSFTGGHSEDNLFDAFLPQPREGPSSFSLKIDSWSYKHQTTGSPSNPTSSLLQSSEESHQTNYPGMTNKEDTKPDASDSHPPKYDSPKYDSEEPSSDSEEIEVEKPYLGDVRPSAFQHTNSRSRKDSVPTQINHMNDTIVADEGNESSSSASFPGVKNLEVEPSSDAENWRSGISIRSSKLAQRNDASHVNDIWSGSTKEQANTVISDEGSGGILNFGALTGGLRQRGYCRPTYLRNTGVDAPYRSKTDSDDISLTKEKDNSVSMSELSTSIDATDEETLSKDSLTNTFRYKSRTPRADADAVESRSEGLLTSSNRKPGPSVHSDLENEGRIADIAVEGWESRYEGLFTSSDRSPDDTSVTRSFSSQYRKNSEDTEHTVHESYLVRRQRKEYNEYTPRSTVRLTGDDVSTPKSEKLELDDSTPIEESTVYHLTRTHKNSEVPDERSFRQKPQTRAYNDSSSRMPISHTHFDDTGAEEKDPQTTSVREGNNLVNDERSFRQKPQTRAYNDSSSRMPISHTHFDDTGAEEKDPQTTSVREGNNLVKLSRRTRPTPSVAKEEKVPREFDQSNMAPVKGPKSSLVNAAADSSSGRKEHFCNLDEVEPSKPKQSYSFVEASSPKHLQTESSIGRSPKSSQDESRQPSVKENDEKPTVSSSDKTISRENSSNSASHVHPKLPDYDSITAHFHSLRANVRRK